MPIPLLRGLEPELEVLPEAVFGQGCAAFAVDDRILAEPGWDDDLVRVTGHCGATLVVLSDDARVMERIVGGLPLPLDGGRVVLAPSDAAGMRAAEWWPAVRSGTVRMVSLGAEEGAADRQFLARLWRGGVASGAHHAGGAGGPAVLAAGAATGPAGEGAPPPGQRCRLGGARPGGPCNRR